jgi:hypothetical protein
MWSARLFERPEFQSHSVPMKIFSVKKTNTYLFCKSAAIFSPQFIKEEQMKKIILLAALFSIQVSASELSCWNLYARKGDRPVLTAQVLSNHELNDVKLNVEFNTKDMENSAVGEKISTKRSPYFGAQEFLFADSEIRLILPTSLNPAAMTKAVLPGGNLPNNLASRQNGVLDVVGDRYSSEQGGNGYTRMHCVVK